MKTTLTQLNISWRQKDYAAVRQILQRTTKERAMNFAVLVALRDGSEAASDLLRLMKGYEPAMETPTPSQPVMAWSDRVKDVPTLAEERWRVVDEGDRWAVWFVPLNHPHLWREIASFDTEKEAQSYAQTC